MKIYEWDFAPNCRRRRMFLLEKGIEVERQECITSDIILNNDYRDRYAHYMVPMLELDDGTQLGEALAIWHFFETLHPDPPLMGTTPVEKATITAWERRAYDEGMVGHAEIFRNSHPGFVHRGLPGHTEPVPQIPDLVRRGAMRVERFHRKFNDQLADNTYIAGETFSAADITTITVVDFGHAMEMQIPEAGPLHIGGNVGDLERPRQVVEVLEEARPVGPFHHGPVLRLGEARGDEILRRARR